MTFRYLDVDRMPVRIWGVGSFYPDRDGRVSDEIFSQGDGKRQETKDSCRE